MVGCTSILLVSWKSMKVAEARRDFKVPVPLTHSETSMTFNCIYRALQSTLELYPQYLFLLLTGGLEMPYFCSLGGLIWILGRYVYAKGYYTGDPRRRANGSFYIVGQIMLAIGAFRFALKRLFLWGGKNAEKWAREDFCYSRKYSLYLISPSFLNYFRSLQLDGRQGYLHSV